MESGKAKKEKELMRLKMEQLKKMKREKRRAKAREDFAEYIGYIDPDYMFNWHTVDMIDALMDVEEGRCKRLAIVVPSRHSKTETVSRNFPCYYFGRNPDKSIIALSHGDRLARKISKDVQKKMLSKEHMEVFPEAQLSRKSRTGEFMPKRSEGEFDIVNRKGKYLCAGFMGSYTGQGADLLIIDDPIKNNEEAMSPAFRDKQWDIWKSTVRDRLEPDAAIVIITTRWHEDDLMGRLLSGYKDIEEEEGGDPDEWRVLHFEAIRSDKPREGDPREEGEPLWPDRWSLEELLKLKKDMGKRAWNAKYQGDPTPSDGVLIKKEYLPVQSKYSLPMGVWGAEKVFVCDTAYTAKERNDPHGLMLFRKYDNRIYIFDYVSFRKVSGDAKRFIVDWMQLNDGLRSVLYVENKASGITYVNDLVSEYGVNAVEFKLKGKKGRVPMDKVARINSKSAYLESERVILVEGPYVDDFKDSCLRFPMGAHDEEVDCLYMALELAFPDVARRRRKRRMKRLGIG